MKPVDEEELFGQLAALPPRDLPPAGAERIRRRARAVLRGERELAARPGWTRIYERIVEPALLAVVCAVYLLWAASTVWALHRPPAGEDASPSSALMLPGPSDPPCGRGRSEAEAPFPPVLQPGPGQHQG